MKKKVLLGGYMRLYNTLYVCKLYVHVFDNIIFVINANIHSLPNWEEVRAALWELNKIDYLKELTNDVYYSIPVIERDKKIIDMTLDKRNELSQKLNVLKNTLHTLIKLSEYVNDNKAERGIDIKIPKCESLDEYMSYLKDINFILYQCPYLINDAEKIKFDTVDVGSMWLSLSIVGGGGLLIMNNLAKLVDKAIAIKSHLITCQMQEEQLKEMQAKGTATKETIDVFKKMKKMVIDQAVSDLEQEEDLQLSNGEERDKVGRSIEKLSLLIDKGVEIYSSIDTPNEVKALFPFDESKALLTDDVIKLIEASKDK